MCDDLIKFIRELYNSNDFIPLHAPRFNGNEKKYLEDTIDSTFVSSVGKYVEDFELKVCEYTGSKFAIATVNGTSALHSSLRLASVEQGTEVITQSLTFVATSNAIRYCGAKPIFIDVNPLTLGLCPVSLETFLDERCEPRNDGFCWNKASGRKIAACIVMHTFGFPAELDKIKIICNRYNIKLIEDAAGSMGSLYKNVHVGNVGHLSILSFNGNKIITTGGGGMILTNNEDLAKKAKHITTTSKVNHPWKIEHDEVGYNYRMPNLNASLGIAQMESLPAYLKNKRDIAGQYNKWCGENDVQFMIEPKNTKSNYWLNTIVTIDKKQRDSVLLATNNANIMTRPAWTPMHNLSINSDCESSDLTNTEWLADRIVNLPSSPNI